MLAAGLGELHEQVRDWARDQALRARALGLGPPGADDSDGDLHVASVRGKPGRGWQIGYRVGARASARVLTVRAAALPGPVELSWFPSDPALPHLESLLALRELPVTTGPALQVTAVRAVRYKPGERCVLRLQLADGSAMYGKVFAQDGAAELAHDRQQQLWARRVTDWLAEPLAGGPIGGMAVSHGVETGTRARRGAPRAASARIGPIAAELLAGLHATPPPDGLGVQHPGKDVERTLARAAALDAWAGIGDRATLAAKALVERVPQSPSAFVLGHGAFKPSQLVQGENGWAVVDLDGIGLADPARDLGYLLAYLRPPALLGHGRGAAAHAGVTVAVHQRYAQVRGGSDGDRERREAAARWYEAATLFKIAHRRVNRRQAPRPQEVAVLADAVAALLSGAPR